MLCVVREDYSADGDAWNRTCPGRPPDAFVCKLTPADFPHGHARSRAYRWGEDGIAGVSDTHTLMNVAFAFWNEEEYVPLTVSLDGD